MGTSKVSEGKTVELFIASIYIKMFNTKNVYKMHKKSSRRIHAKRLIMITSERKNCGEIRKGRKEEGEKDDILLFLLIFLIYLNLSQ